MTFPFLSTVTLMLFQRVLTRFENISAEIKLTFARSSTDEAEDAVRIENILLSPLTITQTVKYMIFFLKKKFLLKHSQMKKRVSTVLQQLLPEEVFQVKILKRQQMPMKQCTENVNLTCVPLLAFSPKNNFTVCMRQVLQATMTIQKLQEEIFLIYAQRIHTMKKSQPSRWLRKRASVSVPAV